ncbi:hypothetical protein EYF80_018468 [Liparis tanakae]|uniref:Uncharacterized protein n=1 Tax=Liparis tanakae TaxID=230148 RepID=A0A4Z2HZR1_9TELE|nr:hypothetical protein EYF80_018468 [Liparis tanakae]
MLPTFDLVSQLAALVLRVVDDGRRGGRPEAVLLHLAPVPLLSGQHALVTLPLIEVVSGLGEVHVETARVFLVSAGAQTDTLTRQEESPVHRELLSKSDVAEVFLAFAYGDDFATLPEDLHDELLRGVLGQTADKHRLAPWRAFPGGWRRKMSVD